MLLNLWFVWSKLKNNVVSMSSDNMINRKSSEKTSHCSYLLCLSLSFRLWRKERARTTTWTTVNWSPCWCSGRRSWRGRRRSLSVRNVCCRSGRWSWRGWSRRSEIWRTTLTRCWCASWSRSPLSCKCDPSWSDEGFAAQSASVHSNLHNSSLVFSLLCCPFWYKYLGTERCRGDVFLTAMLYCAETWPRRTVLARAVLNVAGSQVVFRFTQPGGFKFTEEWAQWVQNPDSSILGSWL